MEWKRKLSQTKHGTDREEFPWLLQSVYCCRCSEARQLIKMRGKLLLRNSSRTRPEATTQSEPAGKPEER